MNDKIMNESSQASLHALRSMLADLPAMVEAPSGNAGHRCFMIRAAESPRERRSASSLVERMYATRGYQSDAPPSDESPNRKTFLATEHAIAVGTLTIGTDSAEGLLTESVFPDEVAPLRAAGQRLCEFTKLAMDRRARSPRLLASLFHVAYIYAHRVKRYTNLLIEVNPRHVRYYETMLGFKTMGRPRHNERVNAPAVLMSLDLRHAEEQIAIFGGRPELCATERSAYPHFFSARDEEGIVARLLLPEEDIAHVREAASGRTASARVDGPVH